MKNIGDLMKQVQGMQSRMQEMQESLARLTVTGRSGGGLVEVTVTGAGKAEAVSVDPSLLKPEEKEILEDLIVAAFNDAKAKSEQAAAEKMKDVTGGLPLPPGFKLPF